MNNIISIDDVRADIDLRKLAESGTDVDNASYFANRVRDRLRYSFESKVWLHYDGRRWKVDKSGHAIQLAKSVIRDMQQAAMSLRDDSLRVKALKHAIASQSRKRLEAMIFLAQSDLPVSNEEMDGDLWAFNCENGTVDARTLTLRPHSADDLISKIANVQYDPGATCPLFDKFMLDIMCDRPHLVEFLKRFIGLCMTGIAIENLFAIFYGSGSNGKTTLLEILGLLLGDYGVVVDPSLFTTQHNQGGPSPELVRLNGVRFVSASEMPEGGRIAEGRMKRLTGGDVVPARDLFSGVVEMNPTWKIAIASNHRPVVKDTTNGFWRRVRLVPFEAVFTGTTRDEKLREKLRSELPGILNWALAGCREWQEHGLGEPDEVRAATSTYRAESDLIGAFIGERCVVGDNAKAAAPGLYAALKDWASAAGERTIPTARTFRSDLRDRGFGVTASAGVDYFRGIGLRDLDRSSEDSQYRR